MQDSNKTKRQLIDELTDSRRRVSELESGGGRPSDRSEHEEKYQDLYDNAPDMFVSIDPGTATVLQCNGTVLKKLGYSKDEMIGRSIFDLYHPDCIEDVAKAFQSFRQTGEVRDVLLQLLHKDGRKIEVALNASALRDADGTIVCSRSVWRDMTEMKREERQSRKAKRELERRVTKRTEELLEAKAALQQQIAVRKEAEDALRHSQKLEAIGQLTSGMAHDFNNLLTVIQTNAALIADELPDAVSTLRAELRDVQDAARHGATLTAKLLTFTRKGTVSLQPLDLADLITDLTATLRRLLPETIEITSSANGAPLGFQGDPDAIDQILMNLANNARDAMPQGGLLRIETRRASLGEEACSQQGWGTPGEYVCLSVTDSGVGMDEETRAKVFQPFFTTKAAGEGTGLGMAIIWGLVKQQGGFVDVQSAVGKGTTVQIYFPLSVEFKKTVTPEAVPTKVETTSPRGGGETILLIEDEEALRRAGKRVLERYGYSVLTGVDGEDGVRVFRDNQKAVSLIITDVVMPKMSGPELYDLIRKDTQSVRFIYTSGYSAHDVSSIVPIDPTVPFVSKPWALSALVALVREVLDQGPTA